MCVEKVRVCNQTAGKAFSVGVDWILNDWIALFNAAKKKKEK